MLNLQLNKKALSRKIRSIKLHNIQGMNDVVYDFPESGLVRIKADNEIGKSILTKTIKIFIKGHLDNKEVRESFIKDGTTKAYVLILLNNNYIVGLVLDNSISTKGYYYIQAPNKEVEYLPISETPRKIIDLLGFYYNEELDFCLNIRESHPVIITDTSPRVTSEALSCAIDNPTIDTAIEKVQKSIKQTETTLSYINNSILAYQISLNNITIKDTNTLNAREHYIKSSIALLKQIEAVKNGINNVTLNISNIFNLQKNLLLSNEDIDLLIDKFSAYSNCQTLLNTINHNLIELQRLEYVKYSGNLPDLIEKFTVYKEIKNNIDTVLSTIDVIKNSIESMKKHNLILKTLEKLILYKDIERDINWLFNSKELLQNTKLEKKDNVENYINLLEVNSNIKDNLTMMKTLTTTIENNIKEYREKSSKIMPLHISQLEKNQQILMQISTIKKYIQEIKRLNEKYTDTSSSMKSIDKTLEKIGVCRLCGQPLNNHNH